jgi:hypothetical protein
MRAQAYEEACCIYFTQLATMRELLEVWKAVSANILMLDAAVMAL